MVIASHLVFDEVNIEIIINYQAANYQGEGQLNLIITN
jgi:hypothetical protein